MIRILWWIRRDLRLDDNTALTAALADADEVLPVFILDDRLLASPRVPGPRIAWMLDGLRSLDKDLRRIGSSLVIRRGDPATELLTLCHDAGGTGVYFNRDYSRYAATRDEAVTNSLHTAGFQVRTFKDLLIHEAGEITSGKGTPYQVYTPFSKAWRVLPKPNAFDPDQPLTRLQHQPIDSLPIPSPADLNSVPLANPIAPAGEKYAAQRLETFTAEPIYHYNEQRNQPAIDGSAIISPYLRWGMISPRRCYWAAQQALESASTDAERSSVNAWIGELIWREFFYQVLARDPSLMNHNYRRTYDGLAWDNNPAWIDSWASGTTGYPIVDAAMHQLNASGWMHNRCRLIVASFLCKDLLIDWRIGERLFMSRLLDADVANNVGNWQWSAGTGTDAAPYFRVFNPTMQGKKFDPDGAYIRHWLPELSAVPAPLIHTPHLMTTQQQDRFGCVIGHDYPHPIVKHDTQRDRALELYRAARR